VKYSDLYFSSINQIKDKEKTLDIQILIERAFNLTKTEFWIKKNDEIKNKAGLNKFYKYFKRLKNEEPIAYILKEKEFFSENFYINKNVLIPRPETEILVEKAMELKPPPSKILDIGAGSGVISIILAKKLNTKVISVERSKKSIYVLKKNILIHKVKNRVIPVFSDLFPENHNRFDLIISNPPYLSVRDWERLPLNIKKFEPRSSLVSGENGTEIIKRIIINSPDYLKKKGTILIEIGYNQKQTVKNILKKIGFSNIIFFNDYNNIPRIAFAKL
jgi:release factor glutamine methyltransferase